MADTVLSSTAAPAARRPVRKWSVARHRSVVGFLFALPLIMVIALLVVYPAAYAIHLATLNKSMQHFVGFDNFRFLFHNKFGTYGGIEWDWANLWPANWQIFQWMFGVGLLMVLGFAWSSSASAFRKSLYTIIAVILFLIGVSVSYSLRTFGMVVAQSVLFAVTAVIFKAAIGFVVAHFVHNIPQKGQRKWRGMLLVPWVIPPAMSTLAWLWLFDPSYSAFNWLLQQLGMSSVPWLGNAYWARACVILVNVWVGSPFFMIMYLAALKSVPDALHEAAAIDGANWLQKIWYINVPMMRNIIQITALFSLIVTFANFDIVRILTQGGPIDLTHVFGTWAFNMAIQSNDIPLGASVSLFMAPILAVAAFFILRNVSKRGNEA